ncbi:MAG TPA: hypothetical protein VGF26_23895, partial [Ramlibacter sp.]
MSDKEVQPQPGNEPKPPAKHGYRNEVNWEGGSGRQPYSNQGSRSKPSPSAAEEVPEGNRAERS